LEKSLPAFALIVTLVVFELISAVVSDTLTHIYDVKSRKCYGVHRETGRPIDYIICLFMLA
jgi:hypothetical protein